MAETVKPTAPLTERRILEVTLRIIDDEGLAALNMRRIGKELGVRAMALYRYVENKDALVGGVVDLIFEDLPPAVPHQDVRQTVRHFFLALHEALAAHPNALPLVAACALRRGAGRAQSESVVAALEGAGVDDAWGVFHAFASFTLGSAMLDVGGFVGAVPDTGLFVRRRVEAGERAGDVASESEVRFRRSLDRLLLTITSSGAGA